MDIRRMAREAGTFFSGRAIDQHIGEVRERNCTYFRSFSVLGITMMLITLAFARIMSRAAVFRIEFLVLLFYCAAMRVYACWLRKNTRWSVVSLYAWLAPIMAAAILMGTFLDPNILSITIMVFLCVLPQFILDKPWRIYLFITVTAVSYVVCCRAAKTPEMFRTDMIDLVLFYFLSLGVSSLILSDRLRSVEYAFTMRIASEMDALTGLFNRGAGEKNIRSLLEIGKRGMFCIIDIDGFKSINDEYGHQSGDAVLRAVAARLRSSFRSGDIVTRIGGDEFAVFAVGIEDVATGAICIERLFAQISAMNPEMLDGGRVSIRLGGSFVTQGEEKDFETLYREGDQALYQAKREGKAQYYFFETPQPEGDVR